MFANKIDDKGRPICMCGEPVEPNDKLPQGDPMRGAMVSGSKGLVILHSLCIDLHNTLVQMGARGRDI